MGDAVKQLAGLGLLVGFAWACGSGAAPSGPAPARQADASGMCQVDVRNGMDLPVEAS